MITIKQQQLERYRKHLTLEERSRSTIEKYCRDIRAFVDFLPEHKLAAKEQVLAYKELLTGKYKVSSCNSMLVAVNGFLDFLGLPQYRVKLLRTQRAAFRPKEQELTKKEYLRLVQAAQQQKNERLALLLQTICSTGIRVSEHKFVTVESLRSGSIWIRNKGKQRTILLSKRLRALLTRYCIQHKLTSGPVFVTRGGHPMDRSNIWTAMKRLCAQAQVAPHKVFPHNLRHLFAFSFYQAEKDLVGLADLLGHVSIDTTRIYTRTNADRYVRIFNRMRLLL